MTLDSLVHQFHSLTLPREQWTHRAHLGVALWTLQRFPRDEALERLRAAICAYNHSIGVENGPFSGYNETITHFFTCAVEELVAQNPRANEDDLWAQLFEKWGDKNLIFGFYSRRYLFSPAARAGFVPPDLGLLPFEELPRS